MAQFRQSGPERSQIRSHPDDQQQQQQISIRIPNKQQQPQLRTHHRRPIRPDKRKLLSPIAVFFVTLTLGLSVTFFAFHHLNSNNNNNHPQEIDSDLGFNSSVSLKFGHGSDESGRDSRDWDRDDRRRDHDYIVSNDESTNQNQNQNQRVADEKPEGKSGGGLYNEGGRAELESYKEEYEASLKNVGFDDEYDDGIDREDDKGEEEHEEEHDEEVRGEDDKGRKLGDEHVGETKKDMNLNSQGKADHEVGKSNGGRNKVDNKVSGSGKKAGSKRKPKHHKFSGSTSHSSSEGKVSTIKRSSSGSSCEMKFLNSTAELVEPVENKKFSRFSLQYTEVEDRPNGLENWEPRFAGHQTPQEREDSYYARDQKINCGFIKGPSGSPSTGFDLAEDDVEYMSSCHIAVASCIFGNSDHLRTPYNKLITRESRKNVCFVMFMDEITLQTLSSEGQKMDSMGFIGLWKIVVVKNLPYTDMRRVGKVPKFLQHRLFPSARYSIWLDSKLRLQSDPYRILEYFLWRKGSEYAISNHYDRHCVWEEVAQNKKLNKFNHTIISQQFEFYQSDGLIRFDPSDPNKLLPSYVPEGSFIIRAHTPMSNLFSCLWFNEVDHFTPRDQLSFAYTYLKLRRMNPGKTFQLNMFKDCERRIIAKLFRHRAEDKRNIPTQIMR